MTKRERQTKKRIERRLRSKSKQHHDQADDIHEQEEIQDFGVDEHQISKPSAYFPHFISDILLGYVKPKPLSIGRATCLSPKKEKKPGQGISLIEIAQEYELPSCKLIEIAKEAGLSARSAKSTLSNEDADILRNVLNTKGFSISVKEKKKVFHVRDLSSRFERPSVRPRPEMHKNERSQRAVTRKIIKKIVHRTDIAAEEQKSESERSQRAVTPKIDKRSFRIISQTFNQPGKWDETDSPDYVISFDDNTSADPVASDNITAIGELPVSSSKDTTSLLSTDNEQEILSDLEDETNVYLYLDVQNIMGSKHCKKFNIDPVIRKSKQWGKLIRLFAVWDLYESGNEKIKQTRRHIRKQLDEFQIHHISANPKPNEADIILTLEATWDAAKADRKSCFIIFSGDRDYVHLVRKLTEANHKVVVIGFEDTSSGNFDSGKKEGSDFIFLLYEDIIKEYINNTRYAEEKNNSDAIRKPRRQRK